MSDKESKFELDDELVSAYLDGELSPEDRAAVEGRLAAEPAAERLLHELRCVSQDVQSLPQEKLGNQVSESVIRRAQEAKPRKPAAADTKTVASCQASSDSGDRLAAISFFGTKRAWIWASLALAAGLLIMIIQSGDRPESKLPPIAQRNQPLATDQPSAENADRSRRDLTISAAPEAPPSATLATENQAKEKGRSPAAVAPSPTFDRLSDRAKKSEAPGPPLSTASPTLNKDKVDSQSNAGPDLAAAPAGQASADRYATPPQTTDGVSAAGGARGMIAGSQKPEQTDQDEPRLVVHVIATHEALQKKSFDQLLARHSIEFEPQLPTQEPNSSGRAAENKIKELAAKPRSDKAAGSPNVDMVLVEATPQAIAACLQGLKQDSHDYLAVEVDPTPQPQEITQAGTSPANELSDNLSQLNRGAVQQKQEDSLGRNYYDYASRKPNEYGVEHSARAGQLAPEGTGQTTNSREPLDLKSHQSQALGRARRVQTRGPVSRQTDEQIASDSRLGGKAGGVTKSPKTLRKLQEHDKSSANNDKWKVLFVLTPEDAPAPVASPADRAK